MRLEKASYKAIVYACKNFHYSKSIPVNPVGYSVFNDKNSWCGVIIFGLGASVNLGKMYGLKHGQYSELTRMALNGKQESTSKAMAIAIRIFKKDNPLVQILISYADHAKEHIGTIYQACNWFYTGISINNTKMRLVKGKYVHQRQFASLGYSVAKDGHKFPQYKGSNKYRYEYPYTKEMIEFCKKRSLPYPKKQTSAGSVTVAQQASSLQEGFNSTPALNN